MLLAERAGRKLERRSNSAPRGMAVIACRKARYTESGLSACFTHNSSVTTMETILALDQGTTSSRAILFDRQGRVVATAQQEYPQYFPQPGWVEHDPLDIWQSQLACAREVLATSGVDIRQVAAIGIANQRETTLLWDRATGEPLCRAIVWQDRRTAERCDALRAAGKAELIARKTGLELDAYFSATKLEWMLAHVPGARARAERGELAFGTVDSWLAWQLTGRHVTDVSNASRTMLFDIHTLRWDPELLALFGVPAAMLPEVLASSEQVGFCHERWFGRAIPLAGIAGDQQAATFGQACHQRGMVKNTYGTGCFMHEVRADGGAAKNDLLMQFQADLLGVPVVRPKVTETTALGAAYLAGLAVGFWASLDEIAAQWQAERRFEPAMPADEREGRMARWARAVAHARAWAQPSF